MVRLGILQCDSLDPPHVDIEGDYDVLFRRLLDRPDTEVMFWRADLGELPDSVEACDAWLVPGSRFSVYDDEAWIRELERFVSAVLEARLPLIGVCFGHQLIARALGAEVTKAEGGWNIGAIEYEVRRRPPGEGDTGEGSAGSFTILASHQDQVQALPAGAELLASAPTCPIAGFTVGDHVITVQGHPEFLPQVVASIYDSRRERIGSDRIDAALATLDRPLDNDRVAHWFAAFIENRLAVS